jgi:hypothetical protein
MPVTKLSFSHSGQWCLPGLLANTTMVVLLAAAVQRPTGSAMELWLVAPTVSL